MVYKVTGIILGLIWGPIYSAPFQFKNEQKLHKMVYIIPIFLVLHFGEKFMKIGTKIAKLQMHENLHKNVNENMFSFTFLCNFSRVFKEGNYESNKCFKLLISYMLFNPLIWRSSSSKFPQI